MAAEGGGVDPPTEWRGEYEAGLGPRRTGDIAFVALALTVVSQDDGGGRPERDDPLAGRCLEVLDPGPATLNGELLGDVEFVMVEVEVGPPEPEELAAA